MGKSAEEQPAQISFFYEIIRKSTHMGALVVPGTYYLLELSKVQMLSIMIPFAILILFADVSRLRNWWFWRQEIIRKVLSPMVRSHEAKGDFTGASYILMSFCLTIALYEKSVAITAISFIIVGDTFAALIGRKIKSPKFYKNKSIAGSIGCYVGMAIVSMLVFYMGLAVPEVTLPILLLGAFVGTFFEAFSFGIDDNVTVPILSGLFMTLLIKISQNL